MKLMVNISIDTIIQLVSFLMLRNKKESLSPLFYNYLTIMHKLEFLMLLKSMLLEEKVLI